MKLTLKNGKLNLLILTSLTFVLIYFTNRFILTPGLYENSDHPLSGLPAEGLKIYQSLQTWIYLTTAAYLLLKIFLITTIIYTAVYINDLPLAFSEIFNVVVIADFVFLLPAVIKLISFHFLFPGGTLNDWQQYYVLSALSIFKGAPADWDYALQTLNVFEIAYWFMLAYGISRRSGLSFDKSLQIIVFSYLPALIIWVSAVTFLTLVVFPSLG